MRSVKLFTFAVSLGSIDSLIQHPASMTDACKSPEERQKGGVTDGLIRISVGVEDIAELLGGLGEGAAAC